MIQTIDAIYEGGLFRPLEAVALAEQQQVTLVFIPADKVPVIDDLPAWALTLLAAQSPALRFLADAREDIYSLEDGEPV